MLFSRWCMLLSLVCLTWPNILQSYFSGRWCRLCRLCCRSWRKWKTSSVIISVQTNFNVHGRRRNKWIISPCRGNFVKGNLSTSQTVFSSNCVRTTSWIFRYPFKGDVVILRDRGKREKRNGTKMIRLWSLSWLASSHTELHTHNVIHL